MVGAEFKRIESEIKKGNIRHRRCDICGCELAVPDMGMYSRDVFVSMACPVCSYTKAHSILLGYIEELRKSHTKKEILKILDDRLNETWGLEVSVFTIDEWENLMENSSEWHGKIE
ncbi:MAG: hypothetical protein IMZ58_07660 [Thermoplasmata archaeon]|nr:hypothetical protein [Thermoplasmata archaeon]